MPVSTAAKKQGSIYPPMGDAQAAGTEMRFISDLGRSLLFTVHPKKVAAKVAEALVAGLDADVCLIAAELENIGIISSACDAAGEVTGEYLQRPRLVKWLELLPPHASVTLPT